MESGPRLFLLRALLVALLATGAAGCGLLGSRSQPATDAGPGAPVIEPEVERREVKRPKINRSDFELGAYVGILSVEDFGSETVYGARLAYHITEGVFLQGTYGQTSDLGLTQAEVLNNFDLLGPDRKYTYYNVALGYNLLPGETFIGRKWAFNSALYVTAGAGQTSLGDDDYFTVSLGAGYRVLATDWLALHFGVQDHIFEQEITRAEKNATHNIELTFGLTVFF